MFDSGTDTPIASRNIEIGRFVGGSFVSLGSGTTDSVGVFNIYFNAGPGGNFSIRKLLQNFDS